MKKLALSLLLLVGGLAACSGGGAGDATFSNPVIRGDIPDPSVIRIGETYYLAGTSSEWAPHYPLFASEDLVNWRPLGHVFAQRPAWTSSSFWAPELFHRNGTTYCYYTARRASDGISCIGVATTSRPGEPFEDHGLLVEHGREAIDAFVFDDDGQLYITWKAYGLDKRPIELLGCRLSADGLRLEGEPFMLLRDDERIGMEGQYIFREGGYYYLVYAARGCCGPRSDYDVRVARAKRFEGPYEKYGGNPILRGGVDFLSCGHGTGVRTPDGRHFFICHAYLKEAGFFQGRQPILQEIRVGDDGWVHFTAGECAAVRLPVPFAGSEQRPAEGFADDFGGRRLDPAWSWNYVSVDVEARLEGGRLLLGGRPRVKGCNGAALCLRPQAKDYAYAVKVFRPASGMAGLTMYGDNRHLLAWGLRDGELVLRRVAGDSDEVLFREATDAEALWLKIEVHEGQYCACFWSPDGRTWHAAEIPDSETRGMTRWDRVSRPGVLYAGEPEECAAFDEFRMTFL